MDKIDPRIFASIYDYDCDVPISLKKNDSLVRMVEFEQTKLEPPECGIFPNGLDDLEPLNMFRQISAGSSAMNYPGQSYLSGYYDKA